MIRMLYVYSVQGEILARYRGLGFNLGPLLVFCSHNNVTPAGFSPFLAATKDKADTEKCVFRGEKQHQHRVAAADPIWSAPAWAVEDARPELLRRADTC